MWLKMGPVSNDAYFSKTNVKKNQNKQLTQTDFAFLFTEVLVQITCWQWVGGGGVGNGTVLALSKHST